ncbi:DUF2935 domain-containing protein [Cohnella sp.]|uniref:DUF2935 domain-containing protein n=1 Tax=Cohnella sp. TaxID=1883426 RepID=UPI0035681AE6
MLNSTSIRPWEEHRFWVEILQDHAYFVRDHLAAPETSAIQIAQFHINAFQMLLDHLNEVEQTANHSSQQIIAFSRMVLPVAEGYYQFEGNLQRLRIANKINLNLSPTYLNGTLNENQEYLRILAFTVEGRPPEPLPLVDLMDLWLEDQLGHAILLVNVLDPAEFGARERSERHAQVFRALFTQNEIVRGYLRFTSPNFPVHIKLARDTLESCALIKPSFLDNIQLPSDPPVI